MPLVKLPGMIDAHVHLREPGATHKEDFATGTAAALAGGVIAVLDMPNNSPPVVDEATLEAKRCLAAQKALCDYGFYVGATEDNASRLASLAGKAVGLKIYLNETYGPLRIQRLWALMEHFRHWPLNRPIALHSEGVFLAAAIALAHIYGRRIHICHVSRREEIALIRGAKERGVKVTCEVTPHHLFLTERDAEALGPFAYMKPTLGTPQDRDALWANLDVVDVIASDHAPHTREEKLSPNPPPGVPGLETTMPLLFTAVREGRLTMERLVELTFANPARIFGIRPPAETWVEVDPGVRWEISSRNLQTKCGWTPFEGWEVFGAIRRIYIQGVKVYENGQILAKLGFGKEIKGFRARTAPSLEKPIS